MLRKLLPLAMMAFFALPCAAQYGNTIKIENGIIEGMPVPGSGVVVFQGVPYAKPPVGDLRWKAPQRAAAWAGVKIADHFGQRPMQKRIFGDMDFRSAGISEDCLYLNVWTTGLKAAKKQPVLVYFFGGGLAAGDASENRYDGESMAKKGIVSVTVNYRLGIFGFFAHPELIKESPQHAAGNYGYLDQHAALEWVHRNIAAFGGDPNQVTIAGESAGSISVSVQMASPLSKGLFAGAIGESGAAIRPTLYPIPLEEAAQRGAAFGTRIGASTLADLRALPADQLLDSVNKPNDPVSPTTIDGYLIPKPLVEIFEKGEQQQVPVLVGWNSAEVPAAALLGPATPTKKRYDSTVKAQFPSFTDSLLKYYPAAKDADVRVAATELASDRFIVYSTWKWADAVLNSSTKPVFRYRFSRIRPAMKAELGNAEPGLAGGVVKGTGPVQPKPLPLGASHASEIEYALGNLASNKVFGWTPDDYKVSEIMLTYFANFIKTGDPNGDGQPQWKPLSKNQAGEFMDIDVLTQSMVEKDRERHLFLDNLYGK